MFCTMHLIQPSPFSILVRGLYLMTDRIARPPFQGTKPCACPVTHVRHFTKDFMEVIGTLLGTTSIHRLTNTWHMCKGAYVVGGVFGLCQINLWIEILKMLG